MSSPFLLRFSEAIVTGLQKESLLEITPGGHGNVVSRLATYLGSVETGSLISSVVKGLMAAQEVEELYADDDDIKRVIDGMQRAQLHR